jgi:hypothetical protein
MSITLEELEQLAALDNTLVDESLMDSAKLDYDIDEFLDMGESPEGTFGVIDKATWLAWYKSPDNIKIFDPQQIVEDLDIKLLLDSLDLYFMEQETGLFDGETLSATKVNVKSINDIIMGMKKLRETKLVFLHNISYTPERVDAPKKRGVMPVVHPDFYTVQYCAIVDYDVETDF